MATANANLASELIGNKEVAALIAAAITLKKSKVKAAGTASTGGKYINILDEKATKHILYGDATGGGHMYPGKAGKTVFPKNWSGDKITHEIGDIATSPKTQWYAQTGTGGKLTSKGDPARWVSYELRDGVRIRVVYSPADGRVITAFPDNKPVPRNYKLITK